MSFSQSCASNVVPLMARLVLGAAFIYAGYGKLFTDTTWTGEDAAMLREMGVSSAAAAGSAQARSFDLRHAALVHFQQSGQDGTGDAQDQETGDEVDDEVAQDQPPVDEDEVDEAIEEAPQEQQVEPVAPGDVRARSLYGVALTLRRAGIDQYETSLAWAAALTELVGGALILIGLFSRIWGLGLAIILAVAFYTTTWDGFSADPAGYLGKMESGLGPVNFNNFFTQTGLFVLAFGIFLTGAGAISADRMLFKHSHDEEPDVDLT